ncbi:MAG: secondary thiamine-phosphate synthase enzyme YjbQ [Armatimonadota bacterium]
MPSAHTITCSTTGNCDLVDLSAEAARAVSESAVTEGLLCLFVPGATGALTTLEYEPGVLADFKACIERLAPEDMPYQHNRNCPTGNGHSHVRAGLIGPSLCVPIVGGKITLGTWQRIVLVDFDNRPRERQIVAHILPSAKPGM